MAPRVGDHRNRRVAKSKSVVVVEDNAARSNRRSLAGVTRTRATPPIVVRVHQIGASGPVLLAQRGYRAGTRHGGGRRVPLALSMIDEARENHHGRCLVVAGATYGSNQPFLAGLIERGLDFATEIRPSTRVLPLDLRQSQNHQKPVVAESERIEVSTVAAKIKELHPTAEIITGWLPQEEVVRKLAACMFTAFPYDKDEDGKLRLYEISGAVRFGLAAQRPVIVSRCRMFSDLFAYAHEGAASRPISQT